MTHIISEFGCARLLDAVTDGIVILDRDGRFVFANTSAERITGLPHQSLLGLPYNTEVWQSTLPDGTPFPDHERPFARVMRERRAVHNIQMGIVRRDGHHIQLRFSATPLFDNDGAITHVLVSFADITEQWATQQALRQSEETARAMLNATSDAAYLATVDGTLLALNATAAARYGNIPEALIGRNMYDFFSATLQETRRRRVEDAIASREPVRFEDERDGRWYANSLYPITDADGRVTRLAVFSRDVTGRRRAMARLQTDAAQQAAVAALGQHALTGMSFTALMDEAMGTIAGILDVPCSEVMELLPGGTALLRAGLDWPQEQLDHLTVDVQALAPMLGEKPVVFHDVLHPELSLFPERGFSTTVICTIQGRHQPFGVLGVHARHDRFFTPEDLDFLQTVANVLGAAVERHRYEEELKYLSTHDPLTGLYNRALFEAEFARLELGRRYPVTVLVVDVDGLKVVNDTLGHAAGDDLLRRAGAVLKSAFRGEDLVARIGGDEFAILLPNMEPDATQRALARVAQSTADNNARHVPPLSLSIGYATAAVQEALTDAMRAADAAMYREKAAKRAQGQR